MADTALESARAKLRGREDELAMLSGAVRSDGARPLVLVLHGAPGVGKTALALVAHLMAVVDGRRSTFVPAHRSTPTPASVLESLRALGLDDGFASLGWCSHRDLLVLDGFERLHEIAPWLFSSLLASAGANLTIVIATRRSPSFVLDPFATMIDVVEHEVGNLSARACGEVLAAAGLDDPTMCERAVTMTDGHPLTLRLLSEQPSWFAERGPRLPSTVSTAVARRFLDDALANAEQDALAALMVPRICDPLLLRSLLGPSRAAGAYAWLRTLPYVHETPRGLTPHDLVRAVTYEALVEQDPARVDSLARRTLQHYAERMDGRSQQTRRSLFLDGLFAARRTPAAHTGAPVDAYAGLVEAATADDVSWAGEQLARRDGEWAAAALDQAFSPEDRTFAVRDEAGRPRALASLVAESARTTVTARAFARAHAVRQHTGHDTFVARWLFAQTPHHPWASLGTIVPMLRATTDAPVGIVITHGVDRFEAPRAPWSLLERFTSASVEFGLWRLDLRAHGLSTMAEDVAAPASDPVDVAELREALSRYHLAHLLEASPLAARFAASDRADACRKWLRAGIKELGRSPAHADLADVLDATYLQGAVKQRAAAAELNLPWGTYRHRLRRAVGELAAALSRTG